MGKCDISNYGKEGFYMRNLVDKKFFLLVVIGIVIIIMLIIICGVQFNLVSNNKTELIPIIEAKKNKDYDYNVYYYGLKDIQITYNKKNVNLKEAIISNEIHIDDIINMAKEDAENGIITVLTVQDGGSVEYIYPNYKIIKLNKKNGERDVYITTTDIKIKDIENISTF